MSLCKTCQFGLCMLQRSRDILMLPECREAPDMGHQAVETWQVEEEEENPFMIEDPSKPPKKHIVEDEKVVSYCYWSPKGPTEEPVIQSQDVKECSRHEPK